MAAEPGEVWLDELGLAAKTRPVLISRDDPDASRALVTYVPLTTQNRNSRYEIYLGKLRFLRETSVANVQGIGSIPSVRLQRKIGVVPAGTLATIKQLFACLRLVSSEKLAFSFSLPRARLRLVMAKRCKDKKLDCGMQRTFDDRRRYALKVMRMLGLRLHAAT